MSKFIRGGVPRDFNLGGYDFHPAEGAKAEFALSGFGGDVHLAGDADVYRDYDPQIGGWNQDFSCDNDDFANLRALQSSTEIVTGYATMPDGTTYNLFVAIANTEALKMNDGIVSVELKGKVEEQ